MNSNIQNGIGINIGQMPLAPTMPINPAIVNQPNMMQPTPVYNQPGQILRPIAPTVPTMPEQVSLMQANQFGMPNNQMMNGYNQYNNFGMPGYGYHGYGMQHTTPMPTMPVMNSTMPGQMPAVMPNQFNARTPMANTTPMANPQMMYQNQMTRTNPMMSVAGMNPQMEMNQQYGMAQPNMNMMNGYNQYNNYGMQTPNPMMGRPTMPLQMPGVNNYAYNNYGMPMNQTNQMANLYGMMPQQTTMMNQTPLYSGGMNDPTPVSKQELIKKVEKDLLLKKECKDFTFIVTRTNEIYIFFKRRNKEWIKKFSGTLWNGCDIKIICEGDVVYLPLAVNSYEEFILDNELLIFLEKLRPNFFLKKLVKSDFIKINGQIICINSDNLLEKYEKYDHSYFFISPERNQLVQDFSNALTNDDYLFIDEKTKKRNTFDSLPRLKELENYFEEVKDYEG